MLKIELSGTCKIFRNDVQTKNGGTFARYSTSIGKKLLDGNWDNAYITVQFKKGVELIDQMTDIDVNEGWLTFDKVESNNGKTTTYWKLFINDFDTVQTGAPRTMAKHQAETPDYENAFASADDSIPF